MSEATIEVREGWLVMEDRKYAVDDALADAVDLEARRPESAMRVLDRTGDMYAEQAARAATLRAAAETLRGMVLPPPPEGEEG